MTVQVLNPDGIFKPDSYFQASIATGSRILCLAGQVALDRHGKLVGRGDLTQQAEQAFRNVAQALNGVGASFSDVAKLTIYVPDWSPDKMELVVAGATRAAQALGFDPRRPTTLVGVASLVSPELLIEIEVMAVLGPTDTN
jgi:enamine deaminase RidA (YjgF/YER057c/UK114 family)